MSAQPDAAAFTAMAVALSPDPDPSSGTGRHTVTGWTPDRQRAFVEHLAANGSVTLAAAHVGLSRQSAYTLRDRQPNTMFALAWDTALMLAQRKLFDIAMERAVHGREEEVLWRGECVGTRMVYNDRLLMRLLEHKRDPIHPMLAPTELHQLWPTMLREIAAILPPALDAAAIQARLDDQGENGNDDG